MEYRQSKDYNDKSGLAYYWLEENIGRVLLVVLFAGIGLWGLLLEGRTELSPIQKLARGMGPELAGIVIAAVTIEALAERRQEAERKKILISQLGSKYRDVTEIALIDLRNREWLYDDSLKEAQLWGANLSEAELRRANLSGADLMTANLSGADLAFANLSRAKLWKANLSGADLKSANLSGAGLEGANLSGAKLWKANLSGAGLEGANLSGAGLEGANLSGANLAFANLSEVGLRKANLSGADLWYANLSGADLWYANLSGIKNWTLEQLEQATLEGTIMPDEVKLFWKGSKWQKHIDGPTPEKWKVQYLAEYGGTVTDVRDKDHTGETEP